MKKRFRSDDSGVFQRMAFRSLIIISVLIAGAVYYGGVGDMSALDGIKIITIIAIAIGLGSLARRIRRH